MSRDRTGARLLRLYPPAWRERYGVELETLIRDVAGGGRVPWRLRLDVAVAGVRERVRAIGLSGDAPAADQARDGSLLVLLAWGLFVVGGGAVQKASEHWQAVTPDADRALPARAFTTLVAAAVVGGLLVLGGGVLALPGLWTFLREGGWASLRRSVTAAGGCTAVAAVATVGIVALARTDTGGPLDTLAFWGWGLAVAVCLLAWTVVAVTTARRLAWSAPIVRAESFLAAALTVAMTVMTAATVVWWVGHEGFTLTPLTAAAAIMMAPATALAMAGSWRAWGAR